MRKRGREGTPCPVHRKSRSKGPAFYIFRKALENPAGNTYNIGNLLKKAGGVLWTTEAIRAGCICCLRCIIRFIKERKDDKEEIDVFHHAYNGGDIEKKVYIECSYDEKGTVTIKVKDCGSGIENIEEAMRPLFTTGNENERSGMGFTIMESFMDKIKVVSKLGKGTKVTMTKLLDAKHGV